MRRNIRTLGVRSSGHPEHLAPRRYSARRLRQNQSPRRPSASFG
jgi:hypothetical protein